jgi:hypothetical protein
MNTSSQADTVTIPYQVSAARMEIDYRPDSLFFYAFPPGGHPQDEFF